MSADRKIEGHADTVRQSRSAAQVISSAGAVQILSLLVFFVTARILDPADFGIAAVAILTAELLKRIFVEPFAISLLAIPHPTDEDYDACFSLITAGSLIGVLAIQLSAAVLYPFVKDPQFLQVLQLMSILLITNGFVRNYEIYHTKALHLAPFSLRILVAAGVGGAAAIFMAMEGWGVWSLVAQQLVTGGISVLLLRTVRSWKPQLRLSRSLGVKRFPDAGRHAVSNLVAIPASESDLYVVTIFLGPTAGGIYSAARRVTLAASLVMTFPIQSLSLSTFARTVGAGEAVEGCRRAMHTAALLLVPPFVGLALLSEPVIDLLVGAKWANAAPILSWLALGGLCHSLTLTTSNYLIAMSKSRIRTWITAVVAALTVVALPLLSQLGLEAVAAGVLMMSMIWLLLNACAITEGFRSGLGLLIKTLGGPMLGGLLMVAGSFVDLGFSSSIVEILAMAPIFLVIYALVIRVVHPADLPMIANLIRDIVRSKRHENA